MSNTMIYKLSRVARIILLVSSLFAPSSTFAQGFLLVKNVVAPPQTSPSYTYRNENDDRYGPTRAIIPSMHLLCSQSSEGDGTSNSPQTEESPSFLRRNKSWIIVVDDEEPIRLALGDFLYDSGYSVTACADAEAVFELLAEISLGGDGDNNNKDDDRDDENDVGELPGQGERLPDAIVTDIRMPGSGMSGLDLLSRLKYPSRYVSTSSLSASSSSSSSSSSGSANFYDGTYNANNPKRPLRLQKRLEQYRRIPVVLLSAKAMTKDRVLGYRLGADAYVTKPFDPEELLTILDNLIRRRAEMERGKWTTIKETDSSRRPVNQISGETSKKERRLKDGGGATMRHPGDEGTTNIVAEVVGIDTVAEPPSPPPTAPTTIIDAYTTTTTTTNKPPSTPTTNTPKPTNTTPSLLTPTEQQVLELLSKGYTNKEIAAARGKSEDGAAGVAKIVTRLYEKTLAKTRTELLRWAIRNGYVPPPST